jgi:hypothetical protein
MAGTADNIDLEKQISDAERLLGETKEEIATTEETTETTETTESTGTTESTETETTEETQDTTTEAETDPDEEEKLSHGEKSRLGRKVKRLETTLTEISESLKVLRERNTAPAKTEEDEPEPVLPEDPTTDELRDYLAQRDKWLLKQVRKEQTRESQQRQEASQKYAQEYASMIAEHLDPDEDVELYKLMTDEKDITYNRVHKGDAKEDFLINHRNATRSLLKKPTKPTVPVKGAKPPGKVNVPSSTVAAKTFDRAQLNPMEQQVAKMFSDEELAEIYGG